MTNAGLCADAPADVAGAKWGDAKEEAKESGVQARDAARDAASAAGDKAAGFLDSLNDKARHSAS